jgi:hypothetical protein
LTLAPWMIDASALSPSARSHIGLKNLKDQPLLTLSVTQVFLQLQFRSVSMDTETQHLKRAVKELARHPQRDVIVTSRWVMRKDDPPSLWGNQSVYNPSMLS